MTSNNPELFEEKHYSLLTVCFLEAARESDCNKTRLRNGSQSEWACNAAIMFLTGISPMETGASSCFFDSFALIASQTNCDLFLKPVISFNIQRSILNVLLTFIDISPRSCLEAPESLPECFAIGNEGILLAHIRVHIQYNISFHNKNIAYLGLISLYLSK